MTMLDANYILRFILRDIEEQALTAEKAIKNGQVYVRDEVLAEVVYVLTHVYGQSKEYISDILSRFVKLKNVRLDNKAVTLKGLEYYAETKPDYVDCLLAAFSSENGDDILSFDKKLNKFIKHMKEDTEDQSPKGV